MMASILLLIGSLFVLVAAVGVLRLPDLLMRMHAATKAGTLGAGLLLIAVAVSIPDTSVLARALPTFVFLLLTAPIAAHVIARAAYYTGKARLWQRTCVDELADDLQRSSADTDAVQPRPADPALPAD